MIMENRREQADRTPEIEQHLPWHKPEIQRLTISLDTTDGPGSGPDAATRELIGT